MPKSCEVRRAGLSWVLVITCALKAGADDWPQWRGPNADGVSRETGLLREWPPEGPPIVWQIRNLGEGYSTVAVANGKIYTQGAINGIERTIALREADGSLLWAVQTSDLPAFQNDQGNGPRGTPTVRDGRVYTEGGNGDVCCVDAETGQLLWHISLPRQLAGTLPHWGYSESPLVLDDMVVVTPGGPGGTVAALDKNTGAVIWRSTDVQQVAEYSSPVVAVIGGIPQIVQFARDGVFGLARDTGRLLWTYRHQKANNSINITTPIVADDHVLVSSAYGNGTGTARIITADGRQSAREVYFLRELDNHHGGLIKFGDYVYGTGSRGLFCVNFLSGEIAWYNRGVGKGSLTIADGMIYMLGEMRQLALVEATPEGYRERGRIQIEDRGRPTWSHPVVANGRLYIRNQDTLTAYDVTAR